jgi:hypothetical protein
VKYWKNNTASGGWYRFGFAENSVNDQKKLKSHPFVDETFISD